ncbi:MAG: hypothetical protein ACRDCG_01295 [Mycoplasmoidaceae bacterium]
MSYYKKNIIITDHAIQRFIERCEHNLTPFEAKFKILELLDKSYIYQIDENVYHYETKNNMIFIVIDNTVVTYKWK